MGLANTPCRLKKDTRRIRERLIFNNNRNGLSNKGQKHDTIRVNNDIPMKLTEGGDELTEFHTLSAMDNRSTMKNANFCPRGIKALTRVAPN